MAKGIYKSNAFNKRVGRAGKPYGSCELKCVAVSKKKTIIRKRKKPVKQPATPPKPPPQKKKSTPQKKKSPPKISRKQALEKRIRELRDRLTDTDSDEDARLLHNALMLLQKEFGKQAVKDLYYPAFSDSAMRKFIGGKRHW